MKNEPQQTIYSYNPLVAATVLKSVLMTPTGDPHGNLYVDLEYLRTGMVGKLPSCVFLRHRLRRCTSSVAVVFRNYPFYILVGLLAVLTKVFRNFLQPSHENVELVTPVW